MSDKNIKSIRFQMRRGDSIDKNSKLLDGEPGIKDGVFKIGDGSTPWSKLSPINGAGGGGGSVEIDEVLDDESVNPVQNKAIKAELDKKVNKVNGKGLSSNDYTSDDKAKVDLIKTNAGANSFLAGDGKYRTIPGGGGGSVEIDDELDAESVNPVQNKVIKSEIDKINDTLTKLTYEPIDITTFSCSPYQAEKGSRISVKLSWTINRNPVTQALNGSSLGSTTRSKSFTNIGANITYTLKVTGENGETDTQTASISFYNGVYYGVANMQTTYNSAFINDLTKSLQGSKTKTFTVTAETGEYIYYALPSGYGTPNFNVGGFDGGFTKVKTILFTNESNYTESYDIYKSDNANLGATTVTVS